MKLVLIISWFFFKVWARSLRVFLHYHNLLLFYWPSFYNFFWAIIRQLRLCWVDNLNVFVWGVWYRQLFTKKRMPRADPSSIWFWWIQEFLNTLLIGWLNSGLRPAKHHHLILTRLCFNKSVGTLHMERETWFLANRHGQLIHI